MAQLDLLSHMLSSKTADNLCVRHMLCCRLLCEILDTDAVCSLSDLMFPQPLNEPSVVHVAACIVAAFDQMHSHSVLFRGLEPSTIAVDTNGVAQLVDFRYAALFPALSLCQMALTAERQALPLCRP